MAIHMSNISRSKENDTMKVSHLIEYNLRNNFVKIKYHTLNLVNKLFPNPNLKYQN